MSLLDPFRGYYDASYPPEILNGGGGGPPAALTISGLIPNPVSAAVSDLSFSAYCSPDITFPCTVTIGNLGDFDGQDWGLVADDGSAPGYEGLQVVGVYDYEGGPQAGTYPVTITLADSRTTNTVDWVVTATVAAEGPEGAG